MWIKTANKQRSIQQQDPRKRSPAEIPTKILSMSWEGKVFALGGEP
jgi:hypothetical protein